MNFSAGTFSGGTFSTGTVSSGTKRGFSVSGDEAGFTLIELLVSVAILFILAGLSIASFIIYKDNAEYTKGVATLKNGRTAMSVGELELPDGFTLPFTKSTESGGPLVGVLATALPGANTPIHVKLGAEVVPCNDRSGPFDRSQLLVAEACRSSKMVRWQKFCGGTEVLLEHVSNPAPCL
jgi:prepilin-type N-terminal cleavage/methylation domain-containing protein